MAATEFTKDADPRVSVHLADILQDINLLWARIDTLSGACGALGAALDSGGDRAEPRIAYAAEVVLDSLHADVGKIVADLEALRRWAEEREGGAP